jgi:hypothetical protein
MFLERKKNWSMKCQRLCKVTVTVQTLEHQGVLGSNRILRALAQRRADWRASGAWQPARLRRAFGKIFWYNLLLRSVPNRYSRNTASAGALTEATFMA